MNSPSPPETFQTARLLLRRAVPSDAPAIFARWAQDPEVTRYLVWRPHTAVEQSQSHVARSRTSWESGAEYLWLLADSATGNLLGELACHPGEHGVNLGYLLARDAWGKGLMAEALAPVVEWWLAQPNIFRIWATCDISNTASARALEKSGFQLEGTLRRSAQHPALSSEPRDALCYSRTRS